MQEAQSTRARIRKRRKSRYYRGMGMEAMGSYIQALRGKISRARMADDIGTTENTLWRIESGKQEPGLDLLVRIMNYVNGSLDDAIRLATKPDATAEDGEYCAKRIREIAAEEGAQLRTPEDVAQLMRYFEEELVTIQESDRRSLGDALRGFLAGFRAGRRPGAD